MFHGDIPLEIAQGLKELRRRIERANIPSSKLDETINLATWNIREFGKSRRGEAGIHYIAEIIGQFDLVSIAELRGDLTDLARVLKVLGPYWRAVYSDVIPEDVTPDGKRVKDPGANDERVAFVYDERAVQFTGLATIASPPRTASGKRKVYTPNYTWWRNPFMATFSAGNFDFIVVTAHIQWGDPAGRRDELKNFARWIKLKSRMPSLEDRDILVTGDFNLATPTMFKDLTGEGLLVPAALRAGDFGTNLARDKRYDQILHLDHYPESFMNKGGVLDWYTGGTAKLFPGMAKEKVTFQVSDHLPLWVQINTDDDGYELDQLIRVKRARA